MYIQYPKGLKMTKPIQPQAVFDAETSTYDPSPNSDRERK